MATALSVRLEYQDKAGQWAELPGSIEDQQGRRRLYPNRGYALAAAQELARAGKTDRARLLDEDGEVLEEWSRPSGSRRALGRSPA